MAGEPVAEHAEREQDHTRRTPALRAAHEGGLEGRAGQEGVEQQMMHGDEPDRLVGRRLRRVEGDRLRIPHAYEEQDEQDCVCDAPPHDASGTSAAGAERRSPCTSPTMPTRHASSRPHTPSACGVSTLATNAPRLEELMITSSSSGRGAM